ncbi:TonB-dependent siderophore receptor [Enterobacterales bacterium CwR94]|nr:TonB-dependent siderophore receptor [Enterobacterales bacterium CwR94]
MKKQGAFDVCGSVVRQKAPLAVLISLALAGNALAAQQDPVVEENTLTVNANVAADTGVTEDTGAYNTTTMVTGTGLSLSARETPQSVSVVTKQRMLDQGIDKAADVVSNTTGMYVRQLDADRFSFTSRGMAVNNILRDSVTTFYDTRFNYGDNLVDTVTLDRIEVLRGAAGLMVGPGNPSAAVNLVRKKPTRDFRGEVFAGYGSWDAWRTGLDLSGPLNDSGSVRGRFVTAYQDSNSNIDRLSSNNYPLYGILEADITENTLFTVGMDYQRSNTHGGMFGGLPIYFSDGSKTDYGRSDSFAPDWAMSKTRTFTTFTSLEHKFDSGWSVKGTFTYDNNTLNEKVLWATGFPNSSTNVGMTPGSMTRIEGERRQQNYDLQVNGLYDLLGRSHRVAFGFNHQHQDFQNDYYLATCMLTRTCSPLGDFTQPDWSYPEPAWSNSRTYGSKGYNEQTAGYAVTQISLADPLTLILGGRMTSFKTRGDNFGAAQNASYSDEFVPYGGIVWNITDDLSTYASYTGIFNPEYRRNRNNELIDPVSGQNYEVGLKGVAFDNGLDYSLSLFEIRQDNMTVVDGEAAPLPDNSTAYRAVDGTKTRGFEAEISGQITDNWRIFTGYTQFRAVDPTGLRINTSMPGKLYKLFTTYTLPGALSDLTVGGGVNWQDKTWLTVNGPQGSTVAEQNSFAVWNLMGRYQFTPDLSLTVNLNNVFDKEYYSQFGQYVQYYYGAPRNVEATLRYRF